MKAKNKNIILILKKNALAALGFLRSGANLYSIALCVAAALVIITVENRESFNDISDFETGKVADRDVIAQYAITFTDEKATMARLESAAKNVPAVFRFSSEETRQALDSWNNFCDFADKLDPSDLDSSRAAIEEEYPAFFSNEITEDYLSAFGRSVFRGYGTEALTSILTQGVFSFHREDVTHFHPDIAELQGGQNAGSQKVFVTYDEIITSGKVHSTLDRIISQSQSPALFKTIAADLLAPFVRENVFFSFGESQRRIEEAKETIAPVVRNIEKGKKIIRKGFIVSENEMEELTTLHLSSPKQDPRNVIGTIFLVILIFLLFVILRGRLVFGRELNNSERYLLASITGLYIIGSVLLNNISPGGEDFHVALLIPTSLFVMILAVFMGTRAAMIMALALPLGAYLAGAFDNYSYIIALVSGAAASTVLHNAQNRMNLIKAGLLIAAANCIAIITVLLIQRAGLYVYPAKIFWAALNGIVCGMLTIGCLPPLEHALNAVTPFRLMELSDLNAPILRKLFTTAPGTYSHSLMVANLAEQACQDIGANPLLARVGAYYHDIGKIDNPDYFVENQTDHNRHDEIAPRLSATIIRSHVKLGVEKAHNLGLPKDVIAIIAEHHGNSLISWFYNKAVEQEEIVNTEDFTYPGTPPRSKESAVVMLADITEAAVRTLIKPTAGKIDKFIQQLFDDKIEHGQLSQSDLSFRDIEIIKKAFVRVLAGYYHSRIEYPKQKEEEK
jgi:putative nucleotidyltransferase with HDIG domain